MTFGDIYATDTVTLMFICMRGTEHAVCIFLMDAYPSDPFTCGLGSLEGMRRLS